MAVSCSDLVEDLSCFVDGELDQQRQSLIAEHLMGCEACEALHNQFKNMGKLIGSQAVKLQEAIPDIWESLSSKLPSVCSCVQDDLSAYLDGELIATAKEGVSQHLEQCSECLDQFKELTKVNSLLSKGLMLPDSVTVDIWSQVKARLNEDCVLISQELSSFIDKEVATLRHRAITAHLLDCADCKSEFVTLSNAGDTLRAYYQPNIPEDFDLWPSIKSKLNVVPFERKERGARPAPSRRLYSVAAAVIAGVLASISLFVSLHSTAPQVTPVTAEAYLIDSSLGEPADIAEAVVYDH